MKMFNILKENLRLYLWLNTLYYGLIVFGMLYTIFDPALRDLLNSVNQKTFSTSPFLSPVNLAYQSDMIFKAIILTFAVNLIIGTFFYITIPSLIHPFAGIGLGAYRAIVWGIIFSPVPFKPVLFFHWPTLVIEGQAYIVAMFAAVILWKTRRAASFLPGEPKMKGYKKGLKTTAQLYILVILLLAAAAVYEAVEVIAIIR